VLDQVLDARELRLGEHEPHDPADGVHLRVGPRPARPQEGLDDIGDSIVPVSEAFPEFGIVAPDPEQPVASSLMIYCEDAGALQDRAVAAGARLLNKVSGQFHGDRAGSIRDPYGHRWILATHTEDMSDEEMQRRMEEAMAGAT
jgi:glyoxalase/bleomycin resistance protein/dioxygenase superfamily protein